MTIRARPWLPANAVRDNALAGALSAHAESWGARWFGAPKPPSVRMNEVKGRVAIAADCECWKHPTAGIVLALGPNAHVPIAGAMLGIDPGAHKLTVHDHALLRRLAMACAQNYLSCAAEALGFAAGGVASSSREAQSGFRFALSLGAASQVLELYLDDAAAVAARRAILAAPPAPERAPAARREAIGRQPISVGAMIGTGKLGLGELRTLACGDVLVLDRGPGDAMALAVNGMAGLDAPCRIVEDNGALRMRLNGIDDGDYT
jgi:flagellar motor switch/type III secretory pathway protein FliN